MIIVEFLREVPSLLTYIYTLLKCIATQQEKTKSLGFWKAATYSVNLHRINHNQLHEKMVGLTAV